jgi:hypothetical protein
MILKYAIPLFLLFSGKTIKENACMFSNDNVKYQKYYNEYIDCSREGPLTKTFYSLAIISLFVLIVCDYIILNKNKSRFMRAYADTDFFN